jgi:hypothetical protein
MAKELGVIGTISGISTLVLTVWSGMYWNNVGTEAFYEDMWEGLAAFFSSLVSEIFSLVISHPACGCCLIPFTLLVLGWKVLE